MMLQVSRLEKSYGPTRALDGVDLAVEAGQVLGLLGPNGAGKTTLVSIVAGLRRADAGFVSVGGHDSGRHPERVRPLLGLAPQELGIYPTLSVAENLSFFGELAGLGGAALRRAAGEVAEAVGLDDRLGERAATLSGGQKRRLHAAIALIGHPPLLLLDEPTAGADIETRAQLLELVSARAAEGAAVVYSTHYLPEVERLGAAVAIIDHGRILAEGGLGELIARYASARLELRFEGSPPANLGRLVDGEVEIEGSRASFSTNQPELAAAAVLQKARGRLSALEIVRPSLESVYLAVVGQRYQPSDVEVPA